MSKLRTMAMHGIALCAVLPTTVAQQAAPPLQKDLLKIVVLQGEGAVNSIKAKSASDPVIEVRDFQDLPVEGVQVVFTLPASGPGGSFQNHVRTLPAVSNAQGQATAPGLVPNDEPGRFNIKVDATKGARTASLVISQRNLLDPEAAKASAKKSKIWIVVAIVGGGAAAGLAVGLHGGSSPAAAVVPPPPNTVSITPGTITIGGR